MTEIEPDATAGVGRRRTSQSRCAPRAAAPWIGTRHERHLPLSVRLVRPSPAGRARAQLHGRRHHDGGIAGSRRSNYRCCSRAGRWRSFPPRSPSVFWRIGYRGPVAHRVVARQRPLLFLRGFVCSGSGDTWSAPSAGASGRRSAPGVRPSRSSGLRPGGSLPVRSAWSRPSSLAVFAPGRVGFEIPLACRLPARGWRAAWSRQAWTIRQTAPHRPLVARPAWRHCVPDYARPGPACGSGTPVGMTASSACVWEVFEEYLTVYLEEKAAFTLGGIGLQRRRRRPAGGSAATLDPGSCARHRDFRRRHESGGRRHADLCGGRRRSGDDRLASWSRATERPGPRAVRRLIWRCRGAERWAGTEKRRRTRSERGWRRRRPRNRRPRLPLPR